MHTPKSPLMEFLPKRGVVLPMCPPRPLPERGRDRQTDTPYFFLGSHSVGVSRESPSEVSRLCRICIASTHLHHRSISPDRLEYLIAFADGVTDPPVKTSPSLGGRGKFVGSARWADHFPPIPCIIKNAFPRHASCALRASRLHFLHIRSSKPCTNNFFERKKSRNVLLHP